MFINLHPLDALTVSLIAAIGGSCTAIVLALLQRCSLPFQSHHPDPDVQCPLDEQLATTVAGKLAHNLVYLDELHGDKLSEYERYELYTRVEAEAQRAIIAYVDKIRRKQREQFGQPLPDQPAPSGN